MKCEEIKRALTRALLFSQMMKGENDGESEAAR